MDQEALEVLPTTFNQSTDYLFWLMILINNLGSYTFFKFILITKSI